MPSQVFADLADVRLDKEHLSAPLDRNEEPDAMGSFGVVVKRVFSEVQEEESVRVIHGYFSVQFHSYWSIFYALLLMLVKLPHTRKKKHVTSNMANI